MQHLGFFESDFGWFRVEASDDVVTSITRLQQAPVEPSSPSTLTDTVAAQLREYFAGERQTFDFPYVLVGTEFQRQVWEELTWIPYGQTRTYSQVAQAIGKPGASRAVGMANNRNPLLAVVPCHRVVGADGSLTGYASGLDMKQALLELESSSQL